MAVAIGIGLAVASCTHRAAPKIAGAGQTQESIEAGVRVAAAAARDCPFPAEIEHYEQTTISQRTLATVPANLALFDHVNAGCAILTFTVDETGLVTSSKTLSASPAAFAALAPRILRWSNYASGVDGQVEFMVRLAAETLPNGGALVSLGFKDNTVSLEIPP